MERKKIALYVRVSTKNQSVQPQIEKLTNWASYKGFDYEIFSDEGISAIDERLAFNRMMDRIEEFDGVAVTTLDRFGRSVHQLTGWIHTLKAIGKEVFIIEQNMDTSTKEGRLLLNILATIAEFEREIIRERLEFGFKKAKEEGRVGRPKKEFNVKKMVNLYKKGAPPSFLAKYYGVARGTIYERLKEAL